MTIPDSKPVCKLTGENGNVYAIIGNVMAALKHANMKEAANEFRDKALHAGSYEEVIALAMEYCDVE